MRKSQGEWLKKKYHKRAGLMPFAEVALGAYFAAATIYAIQNENYATVPFFVLFVWGYFYTGFMSLGQTYIDRLRFLRGSRATGKPALSDAGLFRFPASPKPSLTVSPLLRPSHPPKSAQFPPITYRFFDFVGP